LVTESPAEGAVGELGADFRADPAADHHTAHRERPQREVARFGAVDRSEEVQRLDAMRVLARQPDFGDGGTRVSALDPIAKPSRLESAVVSPEEAVDVEQPRTGEHALVAHVTEFLAQELEQLDLEVGPRREVRVAALGAEHDVSRPVPVERGLAE